jgi:hypothetical protein
MEKTEKKNNILCIINMLCVGYKNKEETSQLVINGMSKGKAFKLTPALKKTVEFPPRAT